MRDPRENICNRRGLLWRQGMRVKGSHPLACMILDPAVEVSAEEEWLGLQGLCAKRAFT